MFKKISLISIITFLSCLFFGCSDDIFNLSPDGNEDMKKGLRIRVPHIDYTRATSTPTPEECKLTSLTLIAYYVNDDGSETGKVEVVQFEPTDHDNKITVNKEGSEYDEYVATDFPNGNFKFYLLGNIPTFASATKESIEASDYKSSEELKNHVKTYIEDMFIYPQKGEAYKGLPMTCDHQYMSASDGGDAFGSDAVTVSGGTDIYADLDFCLAKVTVNAEKANGEPEVITEAKVYDFAKEFPLLTTGDASDITVVPVPEASGFSLSGDNLKPAVEPATYTFYVPETLYAGQPKLKVKIAGKDVLIPLGEKNTGTNKYDVLRAHHYDYTLTATGEIKLNVYKWSLQALSVEINAPFELILYLPNSYIDAKLSSSEEYTFKYYSDAEDVTVVSPKFTWTDSDNKSHTEPFYSAEVSNDEISICVNNKIPLAKFEALSDEQKKSYLYFHVQANNLMKRVDVAEIGVDPSFTVNPQTIIIDLRELIGLGYSSFTQNIDYACNFGNVTANWSSAKWTDGADGTGNQVDSNVVSEAVTALTTSSASGSDQVTFGGLDQGIKFYEKRRYLSVTYTVTANPGEEAWLQALKDKGEDKITVKFTVIPFSSNYKIHFKSQQPGWTSPHIYVYQCLELPYDLIGNNKDYRGKTVGGTSTTAALQYCFTSGFCFKGWKGYGGDDENDPSASGSKDDNGFFYFTGQNYGPNTNANAIGASTLNTTRYMWYNFNAAHYTNLISSNQNSSNCSQTDSGQRDQCNVDWNPLPDNNTNWARLWPGVIMEKEEDGWWTYELSGVAEPGKTLIMFADGHDYDTFKAKYKNSDGSYKNSDNMGRFPDDDAVGVPLFDYEDKEGWFVYAGGNDYTENRFYDNKDDYKPIVTYRFHWDPMGSNGSDYWKIYATTTDGKPLSGFAGGFISHTKWGPYYDFKSNRYDTDARILIYVAKGDESAFKKLKSPIRLRDFVYSNDEKVYRNGTTRPSYDEFEDCDNPVGKIPDPLPDDPDDPEETNTVYTMYWPKYDSQTADMKILHKISGMNEPALKETTINDVDYYYVQFGESFSTSKYLIKAFDDWNHNNNSTVDFEVKASDFSTDKYLLIEYGDRDANNSNKYKVNMKKQKPAARRRPGMLKASRRSAKKR